MDKELEKIINSIKDTFPPTSLWDGGEAYYKLPKDIQLEVTEKQIKDYKKAIVEAKTETMRAIFFRGLSFLNQEKRRLIDCLKQQ